MQLPMLIAILRIQTHMNVRSICCNSFQASEHMVRLHAGRKMYASTSISEACASTSTAATSATTDDVDESIVGALLILADEAESS